MASQIATIAEAVRDALEAATLPAAFTVERKYIPAVREEDLASTIRMVVVPTVARQDQLTRGPKIIDLHLQIGILKKLTALANPEEGDDTTNAEIDGLVEFAEAVANFFKPGFTAAGAPWLESELAPIYDPEKLRNERVFQSLVTVTFKVKV